MGDCAGGTASPSYAAAVALRASPHDSRPPVAEGARRARVLVISQNAHVPRDRRVWNELRALEAGGYEVVAICPKGDGVENARF